MNPNRLCETAAPWRRACPAAGVLLTATSLITSAHLTRRKRVTLREEPLGDHPEISSRISEKRGTDLACAVFSRSLATWSTWESERQNLYGAAPAVGLADLGRRVNLVERSVRRGEGERELVETLHRDSEGKWE